MSSHPRILALASAQPPIRYPQDEVLAFVQGYLLGDDWRDHPERAARAHTLAQTFAAAHIAERQCAIDLPTFYRQPRSTGERMAVYRDAAYALGGDALRAALASGPDARPATAISDLYVVSCTGYTAPGLDVLLARDLGLPRDVRRVNVGHLFLSFY